MKRFILLIIAAVIPVMMFAQAQITTKKAKIEDFTEKTLKVVTSGNIFLDQTLKEEVRNRWRISPYEFCTIGDFEKLKTSDKYYFMMVVKGQFRREAEPGLDLISIVKGGEGADKGINDMLEVVSIPIMSAKNPSGREFVFMSAILDILQEHIVMSMEKDVNAYTGLSNHTLNISSSKDKKIVFADEDLAEDITENVKKLYSKKGISFTDADTADELMMEYEPGTLVSFTVSPTEYEKGSFCYKMLIDAQTHKLYYYRRHKITKKFTPGFLIEDLNRIATSR